MNWIKAIILIITMFAALSSFGQTWEPVFNERDLSQWNTYGGTAKFELVDGEIVGSAVSNTPSTYLCTKKPYDNFILEFQVFLEDQLNTGVQFRSQLDEQGTVYGYQCEIDPKKRRWTGGIYDQSRRGWLYPLSRNEKARGAFEMGAWNVIRIEAYGYYMNTYVNGQHCSRLVDELSPQGFIGLQIHSIGDKKSEEGYTVRWRQFRIITSDVEKYIQTDPSVTEISYLTNQLSAWEEQSGFRLLWDGKSTAGWHGFRSDKFPNEGWTMKDGTLTVVKKTKEASHQHLVTDELFGNFELELDFMLTEGANSGIRYFVNEEYSASGCEYQLLDDQLHPDASLGIDGNRKLAALYDLIPATLISKGARKDPFKGIEFWNRARIVSKDGIVQHWLNNVKVVEYDRYAQMFASLVAYSKYSGKENFGRWEVGRIMLHDHHDEVSFRSIKIRELNQ
ncbi:MAG: DUF1080 domain-containing protein [Bacteroidota bacterium]